MALKRATHTPPLGQTLCPSEEAGVEVRDEALGVTPGRTASSADLGGSSKYSNENFED